MASINEEAEELRRVLFELSMTEKGALEIRIDKTMKPIIALAVVAALEGARIELSDRLSWGGIE